MVASIKFQNFRILRDATLPLGRVTVLIGPNGSGKSTALAAIDLLSHVTAEGGPAWRSVDRMDKESTCTLEIQSDKPFGSVVLDLDGNIRFSRSEADDEIWRTLQAARVFSLEPKAIAAPSKIATSFEIAHDGGNLASVLTTIRDLHPERFEAIDQDLRFWLPEFDRILLDYASETQRVFFLRTAIGKHKIPAARLSQGTLIAVCLLTMSHLPNPPMILGLEEIDRGIHPRLLRQVQDAVHRLAFPEDHSQDRKPVQVVMTTHSPYFVDLFSDTPEDIVIAEKNGLSATFHRLMDMPNADEILRGAHLGEVWFAGVLGGVPAGT